jgi:hypothetical protein
MEISPEERQRIYEEEKARVEAQREPRAKGFAVAVLAIFALFVFLVIVFGSGSSGSQQSPGVTSVSASGIKTLRTTYWCGESFDDAGRIGIAVARGDTAALAGLLARGKAFQVAEGTSFVTGGEIDMGISLVRIESGYHAGRKCYVPTRVLQ